MLKKLYIENYALIDRLEMELDEGLNIITGETGAGKTILLGALGLLLGNRADASLVKDMQRNCVVEGEFGIGRYELEDFFSEHDLDYDPSTVVRRVLTPGGKSRCYINDLPVQVTMLREFGAMLIDIHSQHQNLLLAEEGFRTNILDSVAGHGEAVGEYAKVYQELRRAERELEQLREEARRSSDDREWLEYQVGQLEEAKLSEGEQEELEARQGELAHAHDIQLALGMASDLLSEDETGVLPRLKTAERELGAAGEFYPRAHELTMRLQASLIELKDIAAEISYEAGRIESDPGELERVSLRLDTIYSLQQKHKVGSVEELIGLSGRYRARLDAISGGEEAIEQMEERVRKCTERAVKLAGKVTAGRRRAATQASRHVEAMLAELGMPASVFSVEISPGQSLKKTGMDEIAFLFASHKGMPAAAVEKIASGGEMSRVMLALKSLVARTSNLPTIIFDEIDTGVSGRIADAMGSIIEELGRSMQVVNITHLPQVASKAGAHFLVYKETEQGKARTSIRRLRDEERVGEIAKMLSGNTMTQAAVDQAKLLLRHE